MVTIFIYTLTNPLNNMVFYVGRSASKLESRLAGHINDARFGNSKKISIINAILESGLLPIIEEVERFECKGRKDEMYTNNMEYYWITQFYAWGFDLSNVHGIKCGYRTLTLIHWDKKDIERVKIDTERRNLKHRLYHIEREQLPSYATLWYAKRVWQNDHNKIINRIENRILELDKIESNLENLFL